MNWIKTHRYCLAGLYMLVFLSGFFLLELHEPSDVHIIHCAVDDLIPFNEWFVLPYFLWYAWVPVFMIYFMIKDRRADIVRRIHTPQKPHNLRAEIL